MIRNLCGKWMECFVWVELDRCLCVHSLLWGGIVNWKLCGKRMECLLCGLKWTVVCDYTVYCGRDSDLNDVR